ncbi:hypothetical protein [Lactiplantibacillus plantarum]|uniref:hypothetical protein n=1 Tax=Lactiplantibacillus plantarum TaxID=1590 RepID=UPI00094144C1|nr:hypothetical protein [Lactiplantibacillus plantarum]MBC6381866.1 hypothetical protein [Lactiplantibacillus plantarum]MBP5839324.1 hypothetical protein [Lactiplantibacillus plantarum]MBX4152803.1 hypothetical protein [Lactiplantibacillus plantarum]MED7642509.1 hypothetical protein [Lactiplantibacillus plantarum]NVO63638.1 hypothetical protein [Lactiplantibacillus plantarum]
MNLLNTSISYNIDGAGNTSSVIAGLRGEVEGRVTITANVTIYPKDLAKDETFDDLTKKELSKRAADKIPSIISSLIAVNGGWIFTDGKISSVSTQFNQSETGTYVNANVTATESDFSDKKLDDVTMSEAQSVLQSILKNELPTS